MGRHYNKFLNDKPNKRKVLVESRKIKISRWKIKIVNISKTGYYAPVIEPLSR